MPPVTAVQSQKAAYAYLKNKQVLSISFAKQSKIVCGKWSESDVYGRQIMTSKVDHRAVRVN